MDEDGDAAMEVDPAMRCDDPESAAEPLLMQLAQEGKPIYGLVYKNEPDQALAFLNELGNPFAGLAADPEGRAGLELGITGVPETLLIDEAGIVRARWRGAVSEPVWQTHFEDEWQAALERAEAGEG